VEQYLYNVRVTNRGIDIDLLGGTGDKP